MAPKTYVVNMTAVSVSGAITLLQLKAGASVPLELIRANCSQSNSTTSAMQRVQILRKSSAATVTSFTPLKYNSADAASTVSSGTSATGTNASAEGSDGDVLYQFSFNVLNGWEWLPVPDERIVVGVGEIVAVKFPAAPGSALTVTAELVYRELL